MSKETFFENKVESCKETDCSFDLAITMLYYDPLVRKHNLFLPCQFERLRKGIEEDLIPKLPENVNVHDARGEISRFLVDKKFKDIRWDIKIPCDLEAPCDEEEECDRQNPDCVSNMADHVTSILQSAIMAKRIPGIYDGMIAEVRSNMKSLGVDFN